MAKTIPVESAEDRESRQRFTLTPEDPQAERPVQGGRYQNEAPPDLADEFDPDTVSDDILTELIPRHLRPPAPERDEETEEASSGRRELPVDEEDVTGEAPDEGRQTRLDRVEQDLARVVTFLEGMASGGQGFRPPSEPNKQAETLEQRLAREFPDIDESGRRQLAKMHRVALESELGQRLAPLEQRLIELSTSVAQQGATNQKTQFDTRLERLLDGAGVTDDEERQDYRDAIIGRGMQRYGQKFTHEHVPVLFREIRRVRLRREVADGEALVDEKETDMRTQPPVQTGQSGATGVDSFRKALNDPRRTDMDFQKGSFTNMVDRFLGVMGKATGR